MSFDNLRHQEDANYGDDGRILLASALWLLGFTLAIGSAFGPGDHPSAEQQVATIETVVPGNPPCVPHDFALRSGSGASDALSSFDRARDACGEIISAELGKRALRPQSGDRP
jgi:hypothetical protein